MLNIKSLTFGDISIDEDTIFTFPEGIPGIRDIKKFAILDSEELAPFKWLQSVDEPYLSMMTLDPALIDPTYKVRVNETYRSIIGDFEPDELITMSLIVVPKDPQQMTANLLAPILLNKKTLLGAQVVIDGSRDLLRVKVIKD